MSESKPAVESWLPRWLQRAVGPQTVLIFTLLGLLTVCSSSARSSSETKAVPGAQESVYFVTGAQGWPTAKEAYKPRPDDPIASRTEPTPDWYAEHERFPDPSRSEAVRLSGHDVPMAQLENSLTGLSVGSRHLRELQARAGSGPDGSRVVLLPVAPGYTVMTLSYELSLDELLEWTNALKAVDEAGWLAAGDHRQVTDSATGGRVRAWPVLLGLALLAGATLIALALSRTARTTAGGSSTPNATLRARTRW